MGDTGGDTAAVAAAATLPNLLYAPVLLGDGTLLLLSASAVSPTDLDRSAEDGFWKRLPLVPVASAMNSLLAEVGSKDFDRMGAFLRALGMTK